MKTWERRQNKKHIAFENKFSKKKWLEAPSGYNCV